MVTAASLNVNLTAGIANFEANMKRATSTLSNFTKMAGKMSTAFAAASAAIRVPMLAMTKGFADSASEVADLSKKTGVAASSLSALGYAGQLSGVSLGDLGGALAKMNKNLGEQSGAFAKLGLSLDQLRRMSTEEQFLAVADAINSIQDPAQRTAAAVGVFGKSATNLFPLIDGGAASIRNMTDEARKMGVVISDEAAAKGDALGDSFDRLAAATRGVANAFGEALAPAYTRFNDQLSPLLAAIGDFVRRNEELVTVAVSGGVALGSLAVAAWASQMAMTGLSTAVAIFAGVGKAATAVVAALDVSMAFLMANPITLLLGGLAALTAAFLTFTTTGNSIVSWIYDKLGAAFEWITKKIAAFLDSFGAIGRSLKGLLGIDVPQAEPEATGDAAPAAPANLAWSNRMASGFDQLFRGLGGSMNERFEAALGVARKKEEGRAKTRKRPWEGLFDDLGTLPQRLGQQLEAVAGIGGNALFQGLAKNIQNVRDTQQGAIDRTPTDQGPELIQAGMAAAFSVGRGNTQQKTQDNIEKNTKQTYKEIVNLASQLSSGLKINLNNIEAFAP
jgi:TP901 family phage tail tape measure protein